MFYPFTAPAVKPSIILLWLVKTSMMRGMIAMIEAAAISPQGTSWRPGKRAMPTGTVLEATDEVNVSANRNSFHEKINIRIAVAKSPVAESGRKIL
jgi:hypothetical protein